MKKRNFCAKDLNLYTTDVPFFTSSYDSLCQEFSQNPLRKFRLKFNDTMTFCDVFLEDLEEINSDSKIIFMQYQHPIKQNVVEEFILPKK